jgi:hypothetical protein
MTDPTVRPADTENALKCARQMYEDPANENVSPPWALKSFYDEAPETPAFASAREENG